MSADSSWNQYQDIGRDIYNVSLILTVSFNDTSVYLYIVVSRFSMLYIVVSRYVTLKIVVSRYSLFRKISLLLGARSEIKNKSSITKQKNEK